MKKLYIILFLLLGCQCISAQKGWSLIRNGQPWYDTQGNPVQAHGGNFLIEDGIVYMVGEDRSHSWHPDVNLYHSRDMEIWEYDGKIIENGVTTPELGTTHMIERPKLLHCPNTGRYVIWCHYEASDYSASEVGVFSSEHITGPYRLEWCGRPLGIKSRDCNVFVDDDGTAYFISTIEENQHLGLFRLSDDYIRPLECTVLMRGLRREAPAIVRVDSLYYMLSSACTGWDPNQCMLSTSNSLTEGWSPLVPVGDKIAYDTQASSILTLRKGRRTQYLYVGDRWKDPDLPQSKIILIPIDLKDGKCDFPYVETFRLNLRKAIVRP
ncbi:MAG: family 43 glycosylhydrolase [Bacteroidaceae bacterium]|nr:family 43 glycosylhydrolase [Bacteroidaceae bacterium]